MKAFDIIGGILGITVMPLIVMILLNCKGIVFNYYLSVWSYSFFLFIIWGLLRKN